MVQHPWENNLEGLGMRKLWDIPGGIHPPQNKSQSLRGPIQTVSIPNLLVYPLAPHTDSLTRALVSVGQSVLKGQKIAESSSLLGVPIHCASSGEVIAIEDRPVQHSSNMPGRCIVIQPDLKDEWMQHQGVSDYRRIDASSLIDIIREAGIAGMGGAGFPTDRKLATGPEVKIDTLIINGTECEPYITSDDALMQEQTEEILQGIAILQHILSPLKETLIAIEDNKPKAISALRQALSAQADTFSASLTEVISVPTKYPSGGEKQLIQMLTGLEVPSGKLPSDLGMVCINVGTCAAIYRAVCLGEPLISRVTTVTGDAVSQPNNYQVLLGTPISHLLATAGIEGSEPHRLIIGGPMMGFTINDTGIPIDKTTNCIIAASAKELPPAAPAQACIRCGLCAEACPMSLLPQQLYWYARAREYDQLQTHQLFDCIECGACSYVCPSNIPLVQYYRASKAEIKAHEIEAGKAERARERFENREARLETIERKRLEEREARKAARSAKRKEAGADAEEQAKVDIIPGCNQAYPGKKGGK